MPKRVPPFATDEEAEAFLDRDLTDYLDPKHMAETLEFRPKEARLTMRLSPQLLEAVKAKAREQDVPYQRFIRRALERAVGDRKG